MEEGKDLSKKIAITIKDSYIDKLQAIRSNYVMKGGGAFTLSGSIALILSYGFKAFEEKIGKKISDLKINKEIDGEINFKRNEKLIKNNKKEGGIAKE